MRKKPFFYANFRKLDQLLQEILIFSPNYIKIFHSRFAQKIHFALRKLPKNGTDFVQHFRATFFGFFEILNEIFAVYSKGFKVLTRIFGGNLEKY